jgi:hypothetical protein
MRVIRLAPKPSSRRGAALLAAVMLAVGAVAAVLAMVAPARREEASAVLAIAAALGLGVGAGMLAQTFRERKERGSGDLVRLLGATLDDSYLLMLRPRLPGVPEDLEALLAGPPGIRALLGRRWQGRYRVRTNTWEFDARGRRGWIPCITNPSFEAVAARNAVVRWARESTPEVNPPIEAAVAFPSPRSHLVLEEPDVEVITAENAPWWANGIGRVQRMDAARVVAFAEAVMEASRKQAERPSVHPKAPTRRAAGG